MLLVCIEEAKPKDDSLLDPQNVEGYKEIATEENQEIENHEEKLEKVKESEGSFPWLMLLVLGICWIIVFTFALLKGGHGAKSIIGVLPCSLPWWLLFISSFPLLIVVISLFAIYLFFEQKHKQEIGWKPVKGDIVWNPITLFLYPFVFILAGFFASLLGIGSGMLKAPFLVELGLEPVVAAATSNYMIFWTASITVAQYALLGRIPADYGLWFGCIGFAAALLGQFVIGYLVKKFQKQSFIVFLLGKFKINFLIFFTNSFFLRWCYGSFNFIDGWIRNFKSCSFNSNWRIYGFQITMLRKIKTFFIFKFSNFFVQSFLVFFLFFKQ